MAEAQQMRKWQEMRPERWAGNIICSFLVMVRKLGRKKG